MGSNEKQYGINDYAEGLIHRKARQMVGKAGFTVDDIEDIEQEMRLDLLQRLVKFDPSKAKYNTFVSRLIDRRISDMIRGSKQDIRDYRCQESSLHEIVASGEEDKDVEHIETVSRDEQDHRYGRRIRSERERLDLEIDVPEVVARLPPDLRKLAELLQTVSISKAAKAFGVCRSTLYKSYLPPLRKAFLKSGLDGNLK
jgi:RNA polymerase sigma-70 factor (ECF subfamily)